MNPNLPITSFSPRLISAPPVTRHYWRYLWFNRYRFAETGLYQALLDLNKELTEISEK